MNTKTLLGAVIAGAGFYLLGWLIWGSLLASTMEGYSNSTCMRPKNETKVIYIVLSNLVWGFAFSYIFENARVTTVVKGATMGAILSAMLGLAIDMFLYNFTILTTNTTPMLINIPANLVYGAMVGALLGWWMGRDLTSRSGDQIRRDTI